jgi:hypothetical protein
MNCEGDKTDSNRQKSSQRKTCCSGAIRRFALSFHEIRRAWDSPRHHPADEAVDYSKRLADQGAETAKSAAREAYEEAGVRGSVTTKATGIFSYEKRSDEDGITIPCEVRVFPLLVRRKSKTWPESKQRIAQWLEPAVALSLVEEESLRSLISSFIERLAANAKVRRKH